ncbi:hypothetical protein [Sandarakinorhabdus sp.]|uniref:hypothetical protein n=1 Tax=Sandarakinorhabdus sp. TaxID=1916663 RepID=UPI00286D8624|nr:hypothetical protein [Sandarakinorhabdus sp.]
MSDRGGGPDIGDIELLVLDAAQQLHGTRADLFDTIGDVFGDAPKVRRLLGKCQELVWQRFHNPVALADGKETEMRAWCGQSYQALSQWLGEKLGIA